MSSEVERARAWVMNHGCTNDYGPYRVQYIKLDGQSFEVTCLKCQKKTII